jgi:hypothetical protein
LTCIAKLKVAEESGIRRFLYPLSVRLKMKSALSAGIAVQDESGNPLPTEVFTAGSILLVTFALSLAPYEIRKLFVVVTEEAADIPDPIFSYSQPDGSLISRQERVTTTISNTLDLASVVYDSIEHLASPVVFKLNGKAADAQQCSLQTQQGALSVLALAKRLYVEDGCLATTALSLTACKSWINLTHEVYDAPEGSIISLHMPLVPGQTSEPPICDFGFGNGAYSKIDGDAVVVEAVRTDRSYCWQIARESEGIERVDYQGELTTRKTFAESLWFHWTVGNRSLAAAITKLPKGWEHLKMRLGRNGEIEIAVALGRSISKKGAELGVCLHYLNAVPPIAAATNPASILNPPSVSVKLV